MERLPPAMVEREKFDHIEERLRVIKGGGNYAFADMAELCLVPDVVIPQSSRCQTSISTRGLLAPRIT